MDKDEALAWAMDRVMKYARNLVSATHSVDVFRTLQFIAQDLSGLREAVADYDKTVEFYEEQG